MVEVEEVEVEMPLRGSYPVGMMARRENQASLLARQPGLSYGRKEKREPFGGPSGTPQPPEKLRHVMIA